MYLLFFLQFYIRKGNRFFVIQRLSNDAKKIKAFVDLQGAVDIFSGKVPLHEVTQLGVTGKLLQ